MIVYNLCGIFVHIREAPSGLRQPFSATQRRLYCTTIGFPLRLKTRTSPFAHLSSNKVFLPVVVSSRHCKSYLRSPGGSNNRSDGEHFDAKSRCALTCHGNLMPWRGHDICTSICNTVGHLKPKRKMKVEQGHAAFITGGGRGIGKALAVALASRGVCITVLDLKTTLGEETVRAVEEEHAKISYQPSSPSAIFIHCDVTKTGDLAAAFARHQDVFGRLDICVNNAGVGGGEPFYEIDSWRKVIEVNLIAVIEGTSKAIQAMKEQGGLILNVGSASSFIPIPFGPVYSASKGGVAMFTRSLGHLGMGIRVNAICPEYVETPLIEEKPIFHDYVQDRVGFVTMERVVAAAISLLDDESKVGECVWIPVHQPTQIWPDDETKKKYQARKKDGSVFTTLN